MWYGNGIIPALRLYILRYLQKINSYPQAILKSDKCVYTVMQTIDAKRQSLSRWDHFANSRTNTKSSPQLNVDQTVRIIAS